MSTTQLTREVIDARVSAGELLVIVYDKVYDLTRWKNNHPGGELILKHLAGKDATDATVAFHPEWVWLKKMPLFLIGELKTKESKVNKISQSYRKLNEELKAAGLFVSDYWFYFREVVKFVILWATMIYFILYGSSNIHYFISATSAGILWHQAAFFAHDAGHSGITGISTIDQTGGIVLTSFVGGLSLGWWKRNHNVHHIVTNEPENDPDIQHLPFFALSTRFCENLHSSYYDKIMEFDPIAKLMVPIQHLTFYPIMAFGRFNLYAQSWLYVLSTSHGVPHRSLEIVCMTGFWIWFSYLLSHLPSSLTIVCYVLYSHAITFLLHTQITLSHFGMPTTIIDDETYAEKALRTTLDVECPRWMDWFHGGLQFQTAHHLYPRLPRHNLRKTTKLIVKFAKDNNLTYNSFGFVKANMHVNSVMKDIGNQINILVNGPRVGQAVKDQ